MKPNFEITKTQATVNDVTRPPQFTITRIPYGIDGERYLCSFTTNAFYGISTEQLKELRDMLNKLEI